MSTENMRKMFLMEFIMPEDNCGVEVFIEVQWGESPAALL